MEMTEGNGMDLIVKAPRKRRVAVAETPAPPVALQKQVARAARIIEKHGRVLGPVGIEALKVATLQIVAQRLGELQALLRHNGVTTVAVGPAVQQAPVSTEPVCAICGRTAVHKARHARLAPGTKAPWYCREHAALDADNISEGPMTPTAAAAAPLPPHQASLQGALAALGGNG